MGMKLISLSSLAALASIWFAVEVDGAPAEARLAELDTGAACGIDLTETADGLVITAWSGPEAGSTWDWSSHSGPVAAPSISARPAISNPSVKGPSSCPM